jgi:hypothetical protein
VYNLKCDHISKCFADNSRCFADNLSSYLNSSVLKYHDFCIEFFALSIAYFILFCPIIQLLIIIFSLNFFRIFVKMHFTRSNKFLFHKYCIYEFCVTFIQKSSRISLYVYRFTAFLLSFSCILFCLIHN